MSRHSIWFDKKDDKLNKVRGIIISHQLNVELFLTFTILKYFHKRGTKKWKFFYDNVLNTTLFTFEEKINLFKKIPTYNKLKKFKKIIQNLRGIQNSRNKLAHWTINKQKSKMNKLVVENPLNKNQALVIDDKFIEEFEKNATDTILSLKI